MIILISKKLTVMVPTNKENCGYRVCMTKVFEAARMYAKQVPLLQPEKYLTGLPLNWARRSFPDGPCIIQLDAGINDERMRGY